MVSNITRCGSASWRMPRHTSLRQWDVIAVPCLGDNKAMKCPDLCYQAGIEHCRLNGQCLTMDYKRQTEGPRVSVWRVYGGIASTDDCLQSVNTVRVREKLAVYDILVENICHIKMAENIILFKIGQPSWVWNQCYLWNKELLNWFDLFLTSAEWKSSSWTICAIETNVWEINFRFYGANSR